MNPPERSFSELLTAMRQQLDISQEDLARQLGVSYATVNRWENGHSKPSRLARAQLDLFREKMTAQGKLVLREESKP